MEFLKAYLHVKNNFGKISGLKLNQSKTKAMWIGSLKDRKNKIHDLAHKGPNQNTRFFFLSHGKNNEKNFVPKIRKMKTKLSIWQTSGNLVRAVDVPQLIYALPNNCFYPKQTKAEDTPATNLLGRPLLESLYVISLVYCTVT